jgi:hypothetical protein
MGMSDFVAPSASRLRVMRGGRAVVRGWKIPKPVALVDTREQTPFLLAANHPNWIGAEQRATLEAGDYSVEGMENLLALERKSMADAEVLFCSAEERAAVTQGPDPASRWRLS